MSENSGWVDPYKPRLEQEVQNLEYQREWLQSLIETLWEEQ